MLSALVQSQAAIVAIVITLTLIAVQLTASAYSPRVIDIFKKNPDMWILLSCYGVSIFYGFIALKLVEGEEGEVVSQSAIWTLGSVTISFEFCVSLAYWLGAFTFVVLFPYTLNIVRLLKPESIIKRLAIEITKDKILNMEEDPIQPIMDIVHGSIMKYDFETTRVGLKAVNDQVIKVIDSEGEKEISERFCEHLERVAKLAVSKMDEESTIKVIANLYDFGESTTEKEFEMATNEVIHHIGLIGEIALKKRLEDAGMEAAQSLETIGSDSAEKKLDATACKVAEALWYKVGYNATEMGLLNVAGQVAESLKVVGVAAAERKLDGAAREVVKYLRVLGEFSGKELETLTYVAASYIILVGKIAVKNELEIVTQRAAKFLAELASLSEEPTTEAIRGCELEYREDRSFQKFMKIYEHELEEQRAKKNQNKKTESR